MNKANRFLGVVAGLFLVALAVLGVLASTGRLPGIDRDEPILSAAVRERWQDWGSWAVAGTIAVGVLVALLGLWLLISELRRPGGRAMPDLVWPASPDGVTASDGVTAGSDGVTAGAGRSGPRPSTGGRAGGGRVRVARSTLNRALTRDLQAIPDVTSASVHLTEQHDRSRLQLRLLLASSANLAEVRERITGVLRRFEATTGVMPEVGEVAVQMGARPTSRVH